MSDLPYIDSGFSFEKCLFVSPEIINTILLSTGAFQVYNGIEIAHPVYQALLIKFLHCLLNKMANNFKL